MKTRRTYLGMVGVVSLALSGGATAINLDDANTPVKYAKETVLKTPTQSGTDDAKTVHYNLAGMHTIEAALGVSATEGTESRVVFELDGMVFRTQVASVNIGGKPFLTTDGGAPGDSKVEFKFKVAKAGTLSSSDNVKLDKAEFAIDADGKGSITMTAKVADAFGITDNTASFPQAVRLETALDEDVMAKSPQVKAASNFADFGLDGNLVAMRTMSVGSVKIGVDTKLLSATTAQNLKLVTDILESKDGKKAAKDSVTFAGDFSFVAKATLREKGCGDADPIKVTDTELVDRDDDGMFTKVKPQAVNSFSSEMHLCLTLSDKDDAPSVPKTENYKVITSYTGLANALFPTDGDTHPLGKITRDGTTVHIPYLTTYDGYNHRITLSNRSSRDTRYTFTFRPENDVMATPGDDATGDLAAGETKVLRAVDVVTLEGKPRTAATVTLPTEPSNVDVSTTLVDKSDGVAVVTVHLSDNGLNK